MIVVMSIFTSQPVKYENKLEIAKQYLIGFVYNTAYPINEHSSSHDPIAWKIWSSFGLTTPFNVTANPSSPNLGFRSLLRGRGVIVDSSLTVGGSLTGGIGGTLDDLDLKEEEKCIQTKS